MKGKIFDLNSGARDRLNDALAEIRRQSYEISRVQGMTKDKNEGELDFLRRVFYAIKKIKP